ncbi:MAG TPA: hypothetical protein PLB48_06555 [Treponema sp.]|nr:hypothetical protein [Treponema sp.]HRS04615.1 hypothetical protein [Treponema sp.]HRU29074.1 hypothetical protein [Treponema sp.]
MTTTNVSSDVSFENLFHEKLGGKFKHPKVLWYASGEIDFFPLVGYSKGFRKDLSPAIQNITSPELYIYTCLGSHVPKEIDQLFFGGDHILYQDNKSRISCSHLQKLHIDRNIYKYHIDGRYIELFNQDPSSFDPLNTLGYDALYAKIKLEDLQITYSEELDFIYILGENINFFKEVVLNGFVEVLHLCTIREGCAFGGCRKSIIEYVYRDHSRVFFRNKGFRPETIISFTDFTFDIIREKLVFDFFIDPKFNVSYHANIPDHAYMIGEGVVLKILS